MEVQYFGANCVKLTAKNVSVVIDDTLKDVGLNSVTKAGDIALFTGAHGLPAADVKIAMDYPGEYEVSDISIQGIAVRAHIDEPKQKSVVMYRLIIDDIRVGILGHIYPDLSDDELEALGTIDVLIVPVGGNGYTLDAIGALKLIKKIEPKIIIPTHYDDPKIKYPVPQQDLETALNNMAMEPVERVAKLKIKPADLSETTRLFVVERQS